MTEWSPRAELGMLAYYGRFKRRKWCEVSSFPEWVLDNPPTYTEGRELSREGGRTYHEREFWVGDNLKYMVKWRKVANKKHEIEGMYVSLR